MKDNQKNLTFKGKSVDLPFFFIPFKFKDYDESKSAPFRIKK